MNNTQLIEKSLKKRYAKERRFRLFGLAAIIISFLFLVTLLADITGKALPAFTQNWVQIDIHFDAQQLGIEDSSRDSIMQASFRKTVRNSLSELFPEVKKRKQKKALNSLLSSGAQYHVRDQLLENPQWLGLAAADSGEADQTHSIWVKADDQVDTWLKTEGKRGRITEQQQSWIEALQQDGRIESRFNTTLFTAGDSREPEQAGILAALIGSLLTLAVTFVLSLTIGVASAVYLEEFAPQNKFTDLIEVNINNLAAVPSIIFGLLGLAIFINLFGVPRSTPLVGGLVLSLMTLPTIIVSSRAALKAVPPSIIEAALGLGASKMQAILHHALPLAMPGVLTGAIIGMAQALGETAPLLMIGMIAFIVDIPGGILDSATVLPVQIYLWADSPERAFTAMTAAGILILMGFLVLMNGVAIVLRKRFERRW